MTTILRARVVLPVVRPPVEDGAVVISGNRILAVGRWTGLQGEHAGTVIDLGEVVLLPVHQDLEPGEIARLQAVMANAP